jgi:HAMP domain-containing protein
MRLAPPRWAGTLAFKAAVFITVMCCALAALLGVLVHVSVTDRTVGQARGLALSRLKEATTQYEAGDSLVHGAGVDPKGVPGPLQQLAAAGERGTMVGRHRGRPTMWAAGPASGDRVLAVAVDYSQGADTIAGLDRAIVWSSALAIGATLLVGAFAVTRVTRRLHGTAQVARRISAGDLDARVDDPRTKDTTLPQDEVAAVAAALDTMASSLQGKLLTEQRFTADVAHGRNWSWAPSSWGRRRGGWSGRRGPTRRSSSYGMNGWRRIGGGLSGCWGIWSPTRTGTGGGLLWSPWKGPW